MATCGAANFSRRLLFRIGTVNQLSRRLFEPRRLYVSCGEVFKENDFCIAGFSWRRSYCVSNPEHPSGLVLNSGADNPRCNIPCPGCGAWMQSTDPYKPGYVSSQKLTSYLNPTPSPTQPSRRDRKGLKMWLEEEEASEESSASLPSQPAPLVCHRCFSLKHYSSETKVTVAGEDYLRHLEHLRDKRALILLVVDVLDFPVSLFPSLNSLLSPSSPVFIVVNKMDLLPSGEEEEGQQQQQQLFRVLKEYILTTAQQSSLKGCRVEDVFFVSARTGRNVDQLLDGISRYWGNRGDVYLLGCTNVGKSSLFARLVHALCDVEQLGFSDHGPAQHGTVPGAGGSAPGVSGQVVLSPTVSPLPGTTLGVLSAPLMSVGKKLRLANQKHKKLDRLSGGKKNPYDSDPKADFDPSIFFHESKGGSKNSQLLLSPMEVETEEVMENVGLHRSHSNSIERNLRKGNSPPVYRHWLHDTPGAVNSEQNSNLLTPDELKTLALTKPLKPQTFLLKPGESLLCGGLARLDYLAGECGAYFTVFASPLLALHPTGTDNVDRLYRRHSAGAGLLKIPVPNQVRVESFPPLAGQQLTVSGIGWGRSSCDIIISSVGWIGVATGEHHPIDVAVATPNAKGIHLRSPALFPDAVMDRRRRSKKNGRRTFDR